MNIIGNKMKEGIESMPPDERGAYRESLRQYQKELRKIMKDEYRLEVNRKSRETWKNMTSEQREAHNKNVRERNWRIRVNWSDEERELANAKAREYYRISKMK